MRRLSEAQPDGDERAASAAWVHALFQGGADLVAVTDAEGVITFIDGPVQAYFGLEADALLGVSVLAFAHPRDAERARTLWALRVASTDPLPAEDFWIQRTDGTWLCLSLFFSNLLDDPVICGVVVNARDITDRKRLERARAAISGANFALVHATSEIALFDEICRVVVDDVTYRSAWIGVSDPSWPLGVRLVASADSPATYVAALEDLARKGTYGGPLVIALESHELYVVQDVAALAETVSWRRVALDHGYRSMIVLPLHLGRADDGVLAIYADQPNVFTPEAISVLTELAGDIAYGVDTLRTRDERALYRARFEGSLAAVVRAVATAAELRDPYTAGHQRRVAELASAIGVELGLDTETTAGIGVAASIHDIGKLAVPSELLSRPGALSDIEFALIKEHARAGYDVVAGIDFPWPVAETILQHHERLDGSGYPRGLSGDEISIGARILGVADTVEAAQSHRPYRAGLGIEAALEIVRDGRGTLFDPGVVDACTRLFDEKGFAFTM